MEDFEEINGLLLSKAILHYGCKQVNEILREEDISVCSEFLGFVDFYYRISKIISKDFIVIDFGCGLGFQHLFFDNHIGYIGIDHNDWVRGENLNGERNYCFLKTSIEDFISNVEENIDPSFFLNILEENGSKPNKHHITPRVVGICNKVPSLEARRMINKTFTDVFNYY